MLSASSAGFVSPGSPNYDYHITPSSWAVDQAIGSTTPSDIDGQTRPYGTISDIGADEYVRPLLTVTPQQLTVMVDDKGTTSSVSVNVVYTSTAVIWNATTTASWLFLGTFGSKESSGQTGERLLLWFDPGGLDLGTYETSVPITSPEADSVTLSVHMIKVEEVLKIYLPLILRLKF
jgi:hypothetical protein